MAIKDIYTRQTSVISYLLNSFKSSKQTSDRYEGGFKSLDPPNQAGNDSNLDTIDSSKKDGDEAEEKLPPMPLVVKFLLSVGFLCNCCYWLIPPLLPELLKRQKLDKQYLGLNMSVFAGSQLLFAFVTGQFLLKCCSRMKAIRTGAFFVSIYAFGYALLDVFEAPEVTIRGTFCLSVMGGMGSGIVGTGAMAVLSSFPPAQRDLYIGFYEACTGLGVMMGPSLGGGIYSLFGFKAPFILYGSLIVLVNIVFFLIYMKQEDDPITTDEDNQLNEKLVEQEQNRESQEGVPVELQSPQQEVVPKEKILSFLDIIKVKRSFFGLSTQFMGYFTGSFFIPFFTNVFERQRDFSPSFIGLAMGFMAFCYISNIPTYYKVLASTNYRICIYMGFISLLCGGWLCTFDPTGFVGGQIVFCFIGMFFAGIGNAFTLLPVMPEIVSGVTEHYEKAGIPINEEELHNNLAGYFNAFLSIGEMVGPATCSIVFDNFNQTWTKSFLVIFGAFYISIHIMLCGFK